MGKPRVPSFIEAKRNEMRVPRPGDKPKMQPQLDPTLDLLEELIREHKLQLTSNQKNELLKTLTLLEGLIKAHGLELNKNQKKQLLDLIPNNFNLEHVKKNDQQKKMFGLALVCVLKNKLDLAKAIFTHMLTPENKLTLAEKKLFVPTVIALLLDKKELAKNLVKLTQAPENDLKNDKKLNDALEEMNFIKLFGHSKTGLDVTVNPDITDAIGAVEENINAHEIESVLDQVANNLVGQEVPKKNLSDLEKTLLELADPLDVDDKPLEVERRRRSPFDISRGPGHPNGD